MNVKRIPRGSGVSMICERCGHEITSHSSSVLCPGCGTVIRKHTRAQSSGSYVQSAQNYAGERPVPPPEDSPTSQTTSQSHAQFSSHESGYTARSFHATNTINAPATAGFTSACSYYSTLTVEFILSVICIFSIRLPPAGETLIGVMLLCCSILM